MAHLKNHKLKCPKCGSFENVYCRGGRVKIFDSAISIEYVINCNVCGYQKTRTIFSEYDKYTKIHGLCCPFCESGRKRHRFNISFKELTLAKNKKEMSRQSKKKKHRTLVRSNNGKNNKNCLSNMSHNSSKRNNYLR